MNRVTQVIVIVVLAASIGLHWLVLQSIAWAGMLVTYSVESDVSTAIVKTFDGNNPCTLCVAVAEGMQAEKEQETLKPLEKNDMFFEGVSLVLTLPHSVCGSIAQVEIPAVTGTSPPTPPPRLV